MHWFEVDWPFWLRQVSVFVAVWSVVAFFVELGRLVRAVREYVSRPRVEQWNVNVTDVEQAYRAYKCNLPANAPHDEGEVA